jgi:hypothetical protein
VCERWVYDPYFQFYICHAQPKYDDIRDESLVGGLTDVRGDIAQDRW